MANYQYEITIKNLVELNGKSTSDSSSNLNSNSNAPGLNQNSVKKEARKQALSTNMIIGSSKKLLNSIQNEKVQSFTNVVSKGVKYGVMGARALSGDITAMIALAVDVTAELISSLQQTAMQVAAEKNSVDEARYAAGVLSLEGVSVSKNWWSGRYEYER